MKHKSVLTKIWIVFIVLWLAVLINFAANAKMISRYNRGIYTENKMAWLGILQPYVAPYNKGNVHYQRGEYELAIEQYEKALLKNPPHKKECKIRINLALAKLALIDPDNITPANVNDIIAQLEEARDILLEDGCAKEDGLGHNNDAQILKEEIDQIIEMLKHPQGGSSSDNQDDQQQDNQQQNQDEEQQQKQDEVKDKLQEIQEQSVKERQDGMKDAENFGNYDFNYGDDPTW